MKLVVSLSGGMDSTTLLALALQTSAEVETVGFFYGSKHNPIENAAAKRIAQHYQVPFSLFNLSGILSDFKSALLGGGVVPEGHYEEETMRQTVVPGRNIIFTSVLAGYAMSKGIDEIWLGVHTGDHYIYPDCRPTFVDAMAAAVKYGTDEKVTLRAPLLYDNKVTILHKGLPLKVPYHLTRTCYSSEEVACGRCGACQERLAAFLENEVDDALPYQSRILLPKKGS